jgi:thymidylate synthase
MNNLDKQYTALLQDILDNGVIKQDRTGTGTISVFGRHIRHKMSDGFPLLTTKKIHFKSVVTELLWFLRGDTNIKFLVDNDCNIWNGDAYKKYLKWFDEQSKFFKEQGIVRGPWIQEQYIEQIKLGNVDADLSDLGPVYGAGWRNWGGHKEIKQTGFLHKTDNGWTVKWSDLHSFANGTVWLTTPIQDSDQSLYSDEDEGKKVYYKNIILGYDEKSFYPIRVAKVIDDKFDKYVGGIDQIQNLINDLKTSPDSRRLMVNAWNVGELDSMVLPPCHYGFQVYTRELSKEERYNWYKKNTHLIPDHTRSQSKEFEDKYVPTRAISLIWNQRSVDTFLGLPFNIASYGLLLEIIAKEVNMVPDELIGNLGDTHLYLNHIEQAKEQIGRELTDEERAKLMDEKLGISERTLPYLTAALGKHKIPKRTREPYPLPKLFFKYEKETYVNDYELDGFILKDYQSHPPIKAPLSN